MTVAILTTILQQPSYYQPGDWGRVKFSSPVMEGIYRAMTAFENAYKFFYRHDVLNMPEKQLLKEINTVLYSQGGSNLDDKWKNHPGFNSSGSWWQDHKPGEIRIYTMALDAEGKKEYDQVFKGKALVNIVRKIAELIQDQKNERYIRL
jgi:hypothetical protein